MSRKQCGELSPRTRNSRNSGSTLPVVICAAAFLIAFSLALVYTGGLMLARQQKKVDQERCHQLAVSFAKQLDAQLNLNSWTDLSTGADAGTEDFPKFLREFLESDSYTDGSVYTYSANGTDSHGKITLRLNKKKIPMQESVRTGKAVPPADTYKNKQKKNQFKSYEFTIEVISSVGDLSYSYLTKYVRFDSYEVEFNPDIENWDPGLVYDGIGWFKKQESSDGNGGTTVSEVEVPVTFTYLDEGSPVAIYYRKALREQGTGEEKPEDPPKAPDLSNPEGGA